MNKGSSGPTLLLSVIVVAIVAGWIGFVLRDIREQKGASEEVKVTTVDDLLAKGLDQKTQGFRFSVLNQNQQGSVELFQLDNVDTHIHPNETHQLVLVSGRALGTIGGQTAEIGPGTFVVIPKGIPHSLQKIGDESLVFFLFSTPAFHPDDIVWENQ